MEENEFDEFEAMEAEAEALAATAKNPQRQVQGPGQRPVPVKAIVKPGQPNPNIASRPQQQQQQVRRPQAPPPMPQQEEATPLWMAYHQPEVVGVVNTQTGEKMESSKDDPSSLIAQTMARMLNDLNTVIIAGGYE